MGEVIPGYPLPVHIPAEVRADPDEDNPHELVLDGSEVNPALPPLEQVARVRDADAGGIDEHARPESNDGA